MSVPVVASHSIVLHPYYRNEIEFVFCASIMVVGKYCTLGSDDPLDDTI